jgi:hypothetical protein
MRVTNGIPLGSSLLLPVHTANCVKTLKADWIYRAGLILKLDVDMTSYDSSAANPRIRFNDVLRIVKVLSAASDNVTTVLHLVGWQGTGHDTLYPSLDVVNPNVGTAAELRQLAAASKAYNTVISYHINTDEAYANFTACNGSSVGCKVHPVPGTRDGEPNPDFDARVISRQPDGGEWVWQIPQMSDPLQGPAFHISKTKDAATGTVRVFRQKFTPDDDIELHAFAPLEVLPCVRPMAFISGGHSSYRFTM